MILVIMEKNVLVVYDFGFVKEANGCSKASRRETCASRRVSFFEALRQVEPVRYFGPWEC